ncbi:Eaa protein, partial [Salmonella enterica subsp. enterica serovar Fresno str. ST224]
MTTITKERIELFIKSPLENGLTRGEQMEVARIALASLEADPIGEVSEKRYGLIMDGTVDLGGKSTYRIIKGEKAMKLFPLGTKFYTAPPAPVSVPAAMEIDDDFDSAFEHGKAVGWNAYRAAMLQSGNFR